MNTQQGLTALIKELKLCNMLPKNIDVSRVGNRYWAVCKDQIKSNLISEDSSTGFSDDPNIALLKALSEKIERSAFQTGFKNKLKSCMTERSDGFAAFPQFYDDAKIKARESAYNEAVERYVWATWWDDESIAFDIKQVDQFTITKATASYVETIKEQTDIEEIFIIQPKMANFKKLSVFILFGRLHTGGYISGGACGSIDQMGQTLLRSVDELYRHGLAIKKINSTNIVPQSFYEKRLAYFGLGNGNHLVEKRLNTKGKKLIALPNLEIDEAITHNLQTLFEVHRCYFENQPPFVGGKLERLCL